MLTGSVANNLRKFLHTHDRLYYLFMFIRRFRDKEYFRSHNIVNPKTITDMERRFEFRTYGDMNKDLPLYLIKFEGRVIGIGSYFNQTLEALEVAEIFGFTPVIAWKTWQFQRDKPNGGGDNIYEYFFEQPCGISTEEAMQSRLVLYNGYHAIRPEGFRYQDQVSQAEEIVTRYKLYSKLASKYLKLNPKTQQHISQSIKGVLGGKKTLGIQVRGFGDKTAGHPVPISPSEHIIKAREALEKHGFERIFLATDIEEAVRQFEDAFGSIVVYYKNTARYKPNSEYRDLHQSTLDIRNARTDNRYLMGLEAITDIYTLASCQGLVAGFSNIANAATYLNGGNYDYKWIINKGVYGDNIPHSYWKGDKTDDQNRKRLVLMDKSNI